MKNKNFIKNKFKVLILHYNKLGLIELIFYIFKRLTYARNKVIKISIQGYAFPVFLRNNPSDTQIFTQIFLREELKIDLKEIPKTIIDGGANIGLASVYLKNKYPNVLIYSVEPEKTNYDLLLENTKFYKGIFSYNCGIWNKNTKLKIINEDSGNESFIVKEISESDKDSKAIEAITISKIVEDNDIENIGLLKLDIEGSEGKVFEDNYNDWLSISNNILVEIHNWIDPEAEAKVKNALINKYSFKMAGEYHHFTKL
jgi:FkbM family methyltransferase